MEENQPYNEGNPEPSLEVWTNIHTKIKYKKKPNFSVEFFPKNMDFFSK